MSAQVLIKGGTVLSLDRGVGNNVEADVLIEDGLISEVGTSLRARGANVIDASESIVMPGFVDTHRHTWHTLFRNAGVDVDVSMSRVGPHHTPDHVYAATLIGLLGAARAGITTVVDWADLPSGAAHLEAALQAHQDSGLSTIFVAAHPEWDGQEHNEDALASSATVAQDRRRTAAAGPSEPHPDHLDAAGRHWTALRDVGLRIHAHVGTDATKRGVVSDLARAGLLGSDVTLVHCTDLSDEDLDAIASSGAGVSLTPAVEMADGLGMPPLQAFLDRDIRPGLGVGREIAAPGDMFAQMRSANSVQHATLFDLKLAGKGGVPNLLSTRQVIRYATIDGATAVGLGAATGSLTPGKRGDVVVLRSDLPNIAPVNDPIGAVVWGMDTSNVDWVLAGGHTLVENGESVADVGRARSLATAANGDVSKAAGLLADAGARP